jgi:hypothetical protein
MLPVFSPISSAGLASVTRLKYSLSLSPSAPGPVARAFGFLHYSFLHGSDSTPPADKFASALSSVGKAQKPPAVLSLGGNQDAAARRLEAFVFSGLSIFAEIWRFEALRREIFALAAHRLSGSLSEPFRPYALAR